MQNNIQGILKVDGLTLHYRVEGQGTPVLVIGDHTYYPRTFSDELRKHLQLIFVDHRGFAENIPSQDESLFTLAKILDDIQQVQRTLNLEKVIIVGHSIHAFMALEYAKKYPESVARVVLIASSPIAGPALYDAANTYFAESVCPERKALLSQNLSTLETAIAADPQRAFITRMLKFGPMIWYDYAYDARPLWEGVTFNTMGAQVVWGSMFAEYNFAENADKIACPVLLALGRYDYWNPPHLWEPVRGVFKNFTIRVFEQSGHTPQLEEAVAFDRELLAWLN